MARGLRAALRVLVVDAAFGMLVACAAITGLNRYSEVEGSVDGSAAATGDVADAADATATADARAGTGTLTDAADRGDARGSDDAEEDCGDTVSVLNCGACGVACDTTHSVGLSCTGTTCAYASCVAGWANCDTAPPDTDGCETSLSTPSNCSGCGEACDTAHSAGATCNGSTCAFARCADGWADCDTTRPDTDGCETALASVTSCGACGRRCDTTTGAPSCSGTACSYACHSGRVDCNASTAPDTDGCECATPGCCSGACQVVHSNGEGMSFYDCAALGTYNQTQAMEACTAFTNNSTQCAQSANSCAGTITYAVCSVAFSTCRCWQYSGPNPGTVQSSTVGCSTQCGAATDPKWN